MTTAHSRSILATVFLSGLVIQAGLFIYMSSTNKIRHSDCNALLLTLLDVYKVSLAVILAGMFGGMNSASTKMSGSPFWLACGVSVLWNALLVSRSTIFALSQNDNWKDLSGYLLSVSGASSFLVAGALSFFFASRTRR
jgi:hypothetical protein